MERSNIGPVLGEKESPVQLIFFDWIDPDPVSDANPTDLAPAPTAVSLEQQPAADRVIAPADESPTPVSSTVGSDDAALGGDMASDDVAAERGKHDADLETKPDPIPPRGSIPVRTGREAMQSRAVRLYGEIGKLAKLTPMDLRTKGNPILVDSKTVSKLRSTATPNGAANQEHMKDHSAGDRVAARREHRRAWDRARQEINRAFDDLVKTYAADEVVDPETGKRTGYQVYRLPEVRRRQLDHGAESVLPRPGGGRIMVDAAGIEIGRQCPERPGDERMLQRPESQLQEILDRTDG